MGNKSLGLHIFFAPLGLNLKKRTVIYFDFSITHFGVNYTKEKIYYMKEKLKLYPVSVDLKVSRIHRHLAASPLFGGQIAGAGGTPRLRYLPFQTMEMPLDGDNTKDS